VILLLIFGDENMAVFNTIKLSELEGAKRIDAEFYQPEYLEILKILNKYPTKSIGEIGEVAYGTTPEGGIFEQEGIPFVRSQNFSNLTVNTSDLVFCSGEFHDQNKKSAIKPSDILFAAVGATIGEIAVVQDEIKKGNINQNIARVRIIDKNINPYFVGFFFASKLGQLQIERFVTGNAQPYLNSKQIKSLITPILDRKKQNEIADYFQGIQKQIKLSNSLYSQAENLLLEELGLKDFKPKYELFYTANLSKAFGVHRIDAEYFQPTYDEVLNHIKTKFKSEKLVHLAVRQVNKINPDPQHFYKYIEISNIRTDIGEVTYSERLGNALPSNARVPINGGELLVSKVRPTRRAISIVPNNLKNNILCSSAFTVFDVSSPLKEYIFVFLRSIIGLLQLERPTTGTEYPTIKDEDVENVVIPILLSDTQQKIASLVQQSHSARRKAKELLEEAKRKVEEAIENEINK
jgi:restriction endonuclease S subunit